jgi:hypothetical protein
VLSDETGYSKNYKKSLYPGYKKSRKLYFKVNHKAPKKFHPKEHVMGLEVEGKFKAYLFKELSRNGENTFTDAFAGISFKAH